MLCSIHDMIQHPFVASPCSSLHAPLSGLDASVPVRAALAPERPVLRPSARICVPFTPTSFSALASEPLQIHCPRYSGEARCLSLPGNSEDLPPPLTQQHRTTCASSPHRQWWHAPPPRVGSHDLVLPALIDTNAGGLHLQHETLECNIHLRQMKHLRHTFATCVLNICNIQINCNMKNI
jgi:hypothetical protein